jgi:hypothetical protein
MVASNLLLKSDGDSVVLFDQSTARAAFTVSSLLSGSTLNGVSWTFSTDRNDYYVWYNVTDSSGGVQDPALAGVGIPVSLTTAQTASGSVIMVQTLAQLRKLSEISVSQTASALSIVVKKPGDVTDAVAAASPFSVNITTSGLPDFVVDAKHLVYNDQGVVAGIIGQDGVAYDVHASNIYLLRENNLFIADDSVSNNWGVGSNLVVKADNLPLGSGTSVSSLGGGGNAVMGNASAISGVQ